MKIKKLQNYIEQYDIENYLFNYTGSLIRKRKYIKFEEFYKICMWKSARQKERYIENKNSIEKVSKRALSEKDEIKKMNILCSLSGVGIPTASAILTVIYPKKYAIIDIRCLEILKIVYKYDISTFHSEKNWVKYLEIMRALAKENKIIPRELDKAFFSMHREKLEEKNYSNLYK